MFQEEKGRGSRRQREERSEDAALVVDVLCLEFLEAGFEKSKING